MRSTILRLFPRYRENPCFIDSEYELLVMLEIEDMSLSKIAEVKEAYINLLGYRL